MLSERARVDRAENPLAVALSARRKARQPIVDLTVSNPTVAAIPYEESAIVEACADRRLIRYEPNPRGSVPAREAIARELSTDGPIVDPDRILVTASTSEAYAFLLKLFCDPGDEILVPQPSYPLFELLGRFESVRLTPYEISYDGRWFVDLDSVRRAISPRTRAIFAVSPNNPTGSYVKRDELKALTSFGIPLVCDEVFGRYPLDADADRARTALEANARVFVLGGLSKLVGLPQVKIGWLIAGGPEKEAQLALDHLEIIADTFLSVSTASMLALPALLSSGATTRNAILARCSSNLTFLKRFCGEHPLLTLLHVEGGWYATLRLPATRTDEAWALALLDQHGALVQPGYFFDFAESAVIVLSLLTEPETFAQGVALLACCVEHGDTKII